MAENFDVFHFGLRDKDMARIAELDTGSSLFIDHRNPKVASALGRFRLD